MKVYQQNGIIGHGLRGLVSVDTATVVGSPGPARVKALTVKVNSAPSFTRTEKLVKRPVLAEVGLEEFFCPYDTS